MGAGLRAKSATQWRGTVVCLGGVVGTAIVKLPGCGNAGKRAYRRLQKLTGDATTLALMRFTTETKSARGH